MADPIKSNLLSNTCGELTSSNCVTWAGPNLVGLSLCRGASLTDVIYALNNSCCNQGLSPCYTGEWVNLVPPSLTGSSTGISWTISSPGSSFATGTGPENVPQYKIDKDGNVKIRGSFYIAFTPVSTITNTFYKIKIGNISSGSNTADVCLGNNWNASQTSIVATDAFQANNQIIIVTRGFVTLEYPTGDIYFNFSFAYTVPTSFTIGIYMGSTTFNIN